MLIDNDILYLFLPKRCGACNTILEPYENTICTNCRHALPVASKNTLYNKLTKNIFENSNINNVSTLFYYETNTELQELIHNLKYRNQTELGKIIGEWHASKLLESEDFKSIDFVVPVPIHSKKLRKRGYDQLETYGKTLATKLNAIYTTKILKKTKNTKTQSKYSRKERFENILNSIALSKTNVENKHLLLIDDVITTGATLKACVKCLQQIKGIQISIAAIAVTILDS